MTTTPEEDAYDEMLYGLAGHESECQCGFAVVWNGYEWEHDAAPWRWGGDHSPDLPPPAPEPEPDTYRVVRFYRDETPKEVIRAGLTLAEAQEHCSQTWTKGEGWFDGYEVESC